MDPAGSKPLANFSPEVPETNVALEPDFRPKYLPKEWESYVAGLPGLGALNLWINNMDDAMDLHLQHAMHGLEARSGAAFELLQDDNLKKAWGRLTEFTSEVSSKALGQVDRFISDVSSGAASTVRTSIDEADFETCFPFSAALV